QFLVNPGVDHVLYRDFAVAWPEGRVRDRAPVDRIGGGFAGSLFNDLDFNQATPTRLHRKQIPELTIRVCNPDHGIANSRKADRNGDGALDVAPFQDSRLVGP